jgi:hypothetical protein
VDLPRLPARRGDPGKKLREAARLWARGDLTEGDDRDEEAAADEQADDLALQCAKLGVVPVGQLRVTQVKRRFYLWPANEPAYRFFVSLRSQWRHGFDGPTGLDYEAVEGELRRRIRPPRRRSRMRDLVRVMEQGALHGWGEVREERAADRARDQQQLHLQH